MFQFQQATYSLLNRCHFYEPANPGKLCFPVGKAKTVLVHSKYITGFTDTRLT